MVAEAPGGSEVQIPYFQLAMLSQPGKTTTAKGLFAFFLAHRLGPGTRYKETLPKIRNGHL